LSVNGFLDEIVFLYNFVREIIKSESEVFISDEGGVQIEVFYVQRHVSGSRGGDNAVEEEFGGNEIGTGGANVVWIIYPVATDRESGPVFLRFVLFQVTNDLSVSNITSAICWDFIFVDEKCGVGAFDAATNTLSKTTNFVGV